MYVLATPYGHKITCMNQKGVDRDPLSLIMIIVYWVASLFPMYVCPCSPLLTYNNLYEPKRGGQGPISFNYDNCLLGRFALPNVCPCNPLRTYNYLYEPKRGGQGPISFNYDNCLLGRFALPNVCMSLQPLRTYNYLYEPKSGGQGPISFNYDNCLLGCFALPNVCMSLQPPTDIQLLV